MVKISDIIDESALYSNPRRAALVKKAMKPVTDRANMAKSLQKIADKAKVDDKKKDTVDEDNASKLVNTGAYGKSFDPKYNKHNTPGTSKADGQDGKKKGAMPGMVG